MQLAPRQMLVHLQFHAARWSAYQALKKRTRKIRFVLLVCTEPRCCTLGARCSVPRADREFRPRY